MILRLAQGLVFALYAYAGIGVLLLPWWHTRGLKRLDLPAGAGPVGFRILISPGLVALWLPLWWRSRRADGHPRAEHNPHRDAAAVPRAQEGNA